MIRRIWPLVLATASLGVDAYVLAGILPGIAGSLSTTVGAIGLGVTAFTGAYALSGPLLSGPLVRGSTRRALVVALGLFNLGNLVTAVSPGIGLFLGARVLAGVGAGVLTAVATATAAGMVGADRRGRAISLVTFGLSTGTVLGVPLGMLIGQAVGWRWTMGLVVAIGAVSMAALLLRREPYPGIQAVRLRQNLRLLARPLVGASVAAAFLLGVASLGLYTYLRPVAEDAGLGDWSFAFIWAWGVGGVAGSALVGRPLDRFGPRRLLPVVLAVLALSLAGMWSLATAWAWLPLLVLWGACGWAGVPLLQHLLTRARPEGAMPIVAFQMSAMYLGSAVGSGVGGLLLDGGTRAGSLPGYALLVACAALALVVVLCAPRSRAVDSGPVGSAS